MLRFFCLLTGDRHDALRQHGPASRKKVIAMGTGLILACGLWTFTGINIGLNAMDMAVPTAAALGMGLGTVVFLLDRTIMLGNGTGGRLAWTRVALAVCMALIGGAGVDLCLLRAEIDQTLVSIRQERVAAGEGSVRAMNDHDLVQAKEQVAMARHEMAEATAIWLAELNGTPQGTGLYGNGPVARAKESLVNTRQRALDAAESELRMTQARIDADVSKATEEIDTTQRKPALFDRLHAMHRYLLGDRLVLLAYILVSVVLMLIELAPLMAKWGMETTAYEQEVRVADELLREKALCQLEASRSHYARLNAITPMERTALSSLAHARKHYEAIKDLTVA